MKVPRSQNPYHFKSLRAQHPTPRDFLFSHASSPVRAAKPRNRNVALRLAVLAVLYYTQ